MKALVRNVVERLWKLFSDAAPIYPMDTLHWQETIVPTPLSRGLLRCLHLPRFNSWRGGKQFHDGEKGYSFAEFLLVMWS
jgi:hypothetical protein